VKYRNRPLLNCAPDFSRSVCHLDEGEISVAKLNLHENEIEQLIETVPRMTRTWNDKNVGYLNIHEDNIKKSEYQTKHNGYQTKVALVTGITGQDGSYLAELLLEKGYTWCKTPCFFNTQRIDHLYQDQHQENVNFKLHYGDLTDSTNIIRIIQEVQPDEIYNLEQCM
jgi:3-oxoacyl-ACP reductase-like protein